MSVWSGNLLFLFFENEDFFNNNILGEAGDTYNLLATIESALVGIGATFDSLGGMFGAIEGILNSLGDMNFSEHGSLSLIAPATLAANAHLERIYGGVLPLAQILARNSVLDSNENDAAIEGTSETPLNKNGHKQRQLDAEITVQFWNYLEIINFESK